MLVSCSSRVLIRPEQLRVVLANITIVLFLTQKSKPNAKKSGRYGCFGPDVRVVLRRTEEGTGELSSCGILVHLLRADHEFVFPMSAQLHRKATTTYVLLALPPRLSD